MHVLREVAAQVLANADLPHLRPSVLTPPCWRAEGTLPRSRAGSEPQGFPLPLGCPGVLLSCLDCCGHLSSSLRNQGRWERNECVLGELLDQPDIGTPAPRLTPSCPGLRPDIRRRLSGQAM